MSEDQVKVENVSGRAVLVFHTWLLPGERMAMSLEAAKEAAKIEGIRMVEPAGEEPPALETPEQKTVGKRGKRGAA